MTEIEQLRADIAALREQLERLERRERLADDAVRAELQKLKLEFLEAEKLKPQPSFYPQYFPQPPQPYWTHDMARHFPPGTILC